jgi:glycosyltransferase involved in cell wall biosynthesis
VIAWREGSTPEIIQNGVNGVLVSSIESAAEAVRSIHRLDRRRVRASFERRFSVARQAQDYLALYRSLIEAKAGSGFSRSVAVAAAANGNGPVLHVA